MSAPHQFQLFPPPPTQNRTNGAQNRKRSRTRSPKPRDASPAAGAEETKASGQADAVILKIIEGTNTAIPRRAESPAPIPCGTEAAKFSGNAQQQTSLPQKSSLPRSAGPQSQPSVPNSNRHVRPSHSPSRSPSPLSNIAGRTQAHRSNYSAGMRSLSAPSPWAAPGRPSSPASVRSGTVTFSGSQTSSEVPMTSMFPRYDPRLPLSQQRYYPQLSRAPNLPPDAVSRTERKTAAPHSLNEPVAAQAESVNGFELASSEELVHLWDAANGQGSQGGIGTVSLCLRRIDTLTYTLGNRFVPLYTLKTNRMNDIEIHRTHPAKPNTKAPVVTLSLDEIDQYNSENVSITLFPKLAEIFAREQALELSRRNQLDPPRAMQAENDAVRRAEAQEACVLRWNAAYSRYDLYHHAFTRDYSSQRSNTPNSQSDAIASGMLNLTITASPDTRGPCLQSRPSILITAPRQPQSRPSPPLPFEDDDAALMALDLGTMKLSISTDSILSTTPSLHTIDALIATILTVAVFDDASSLVLRDMAIHEPTPEDFPSPYRASTPILETGRVTPSRTDSTDTGVSAHPNGPNGNSTNSQVETEAEKEEDKQEAALMAQIRAEQQQRRTSTSRTSTERYNWRSYHHPWKRAKLTLLSWRGAVPDENRAHRMKQKERESTNTSSSCPTSASVEEIDLERNPGAQFGSQNPSAYAGEEKATAARGGGEERPNFVVRAFWAVIAALAMVLKLVVYLLARLGRCVARGK